jgi:hypothetical protein
MFGVRKMDQAQIIANYNREKRPKFNPDLFMRSEDDIIEELKKVILSCQRNKFFTIKVMGFRVVEGYKQIHDILYEHEEKILKKTKDKNKKKENQYDYINLRDSDIKLLLVDYYIKIKDQEEYLTVIIAVPRIVDKYYFRISGNVYSAIYQIVDASTYNNSTSNSKKPSVTLKTMFMPIRLYKITSGTGNIANLRTTKKESLKCTLFQSRIFNKSLPVFKYILAKYGYYGTLDFFNLKYIYITKDSIDSDDYYSFCKNDNIFLNIPKMIFDNDQAVQSLVYTILKSINKSVSYEEIFTNEFWIKSLGGEFNNFSIEKGLSILDSLESIYDITTKENLHLPVEAKQDVYAILRWMIVEFTALRLKDNVDISTKKIRFAEYIASMYASRLSSTIYKISDLGNRADIVSIKKRIVTNPMELIKLISKCMLINYRNNVNDLDCINAIKYTYKGIAGIGEKVNAIPDIYRFIDVSHLGRVDLDASSATDPGVTGVLCPLGKIYDGGYFSEFEEPNSWDREFSKLLANYKALTGLKEVISFKKELGLDVVDNEIEEIQESIEIVKTLIKPIRHIVDDDIVEHALPLEVSGSLYYSLEEQEEEEEVI